MSAWKYLTSCWRHVSVTSLLLSSDETDVLSTVIDYESHTRVVTEVLRLTVSPHFLSTDAGCMPWTVYVPTLILIAQAVFLLERGHINRQTHAHTQL